MTSVVGGAFVGLQVVLVSLSFLGRVPVVEELHVWVLGSVHCKENNIKK